MRSAMLFLFLLSSLTGARAEVSAHIHCERPFGYFVGDLVHASVDIRAPSDATIRTASLPHAGSVTMSLDLRDVSLDRIDEGEGEGRRWRLRLTYQNFYVALDVRDIEIPGFALTLSRPGGDETIEVRAWKVGVAPLRAITPMKKEEATDYLRPDSPLAFVDESAPRALAFGLAAAALLGFIAVARDRAWPPFQARRTRVFAGLAWRLTAQARRAGADAEFDADVRSVHRAIDAACGRRVLAGDLDAFLGARPEFGPARHSLQRFFAASDRMFFGGDAGPRDYSLAELAALVRSLAERERAG